MGGVTPAILVQLLLASRNVLLTSWGFDSVDWEITLLPTYQTARCRHIARFKVIFICDILLCYGSTINRIGVGQTKLYLDNSLCPKSDMFRPTIDALWLTTHRESRCTGSNLFAYSEI
jgi:hypothetical protein